VESEGDEDAPDGQVASIDSEGAEAADDQPQEPAEEPEQAAWDIEEPSEDYEIDMPSAEETGAVDEEIQADDEDFEIDEIPTDEGREVAVYDAPEEMPEEGGEEPDHEQAERRGNPMIPLTIASGLLVVVLCVLVLRRPAPQTEPAPSESQETPQPAEDQTVGRLLAQLSGGDFQEMTKARESLTRMGSKAVAPLIKLLESSEADVRASAVQTLGRIADRRALAAILPRLKDPVPKVRTRAAGALLQINDPRAVSALIAAIVDTDEEVRYEVVGVLDALCRHSEKGTPDSLDHATQLQAAWQKWWVENRSKFLPD